MNENQTRINSFFHFLRDILKENPEINFTKQNIYDWITKLDVSPEEYDEDLINYGWFDEWKKQFSNYNRTGNTSINYFCRFSNKEESFSNISNPFKIYIPIDVKHVKESFEKIINFLNDNNIAYNAKIAREIRIDNIVVRLTSENDVKLLIEFINNDEYIKEGLRKPSPFCFNYNGIALTLDGNMSYHNVLVDYIYNFINEKKKKNDLDSIDYQSFYNYVKELYTNEYENFSSFSNIKLSEYNQKSSCEKNLLINKQITNLFLLLNNGSFNESVFFNLFKEYNDPNTINNEYSDLYVLRILSAIIKLHGDKYGVEKAYKAIRKYIETDKVEYITNKAILRNEILNNDFLSKLQIFLEKYNTTIDELCLLLSNNEIQIPEFIKKNDEEIDKIKNDVDKKLKNIIDELCILEIENLKNNNINMNNSKIIQEALVITLRRLKVLFATFNIQSITRTKNLRQRCVSLRSNLLTVLYNTGKNIDTYMINLVCDSLLLKESILDEAIFSTYKKYQELYDNGNSEYDGLILAECALDLLLTENNYNGFTRDNNTRELLSNITKKETLKIMSKKLEIPNINTIIHQDKKKTDLIEEYINLIISDYSLVNNRTK